MKCSRFVVTVLGLLLSAVVPAAQASPPQNKLIVHEWGTFLTVQGSNGMTMAGMVDSEEKLPPFVLERGPAGWERTQARMRSFIRSKMETPVTYFYTDVPMEVRVRVAMPQGVLTHWYPVVREMTPAWKKEEKVQPHQGSSLDWGFFELLPEKQFGPKNPRPALPPLKGDEPWRFVRETDSAIIKQVSGRDNEKGKEWEYEKFLFYRGLGHMDLPLKVESALVNNASDIQFTLTNRSMQNIGPIMLVEVASGKISFGKIEGVEPFLPALRVRSQLLGKALPLAEGVPQAKAQLEQLLVAQGLYPKEAAAMVNNWEHSYFATQGTRALYVVPRPLTDAQIPIRIDPAPRELVRVMVGRVEVLHPLTEACLLDAVRDLASSDPAKKAAAEKTLADLGRLREPALRRVAELAEEAQVKATVEKLLASHGKW